MSPKQLPNGAVDILVIHGPNLNLLGKREPDIYGEETLDDVNAMLQHIADRHSVHLECFQSNHEGAIVDKIHACMETFEGIIINAGAYTHTSVAIRDALAIFDKPIVEVHISNVHAREDFRNDSLLAPVVTGVISGFGVDSYRLAFLWLIKHWDK